MSRSDLYSSRTGEGTSVSTALMTSLRRTADDNFGYGEEASGVATIQATSSTAITDTAAPSTESTVWAGCQVIRLRSSPPSQTATTCPASAQTSTTAIARITRPFDWWASRRATGSA